MNVKFYRGKRLWLDLQVDWSAWLIGVDVDRFYSYYDNRKNTDVILFIGPLAISILL